MLEIEAKAVKIEKEAEKESQPAVQAQICEQPAMRMEGSAIDGAIQEELASPEELPAT